MSPSHSADLIAVVGALLALVALALGARWLRTRPYRVLFRMPIRRNDSCTCRGAHQTAPISLRPNGFDLPSGLQEQGQTAFLEMEIEATTLGAFSDPFVEVRRGVICFRQYFERGAAGRRRLNISPLFQKRAAPEGARVALVGRGLRWASQGTMSLFDAPPVEGANVLILAPHPDDAEIAAFGIYAQRPSPAWVATMTGGDRGMAKLSSVVPHADGARWSADLRVWDSLTIPQIGGVPRERCVNFVHPDGALRQMHAQPTVAVGLACEEALSRTTLRARNAAPEFRAGNPTCTWRDVVEDLRRLLEKADPEIVACPHPLVDGHHDHVFTTVAVAEAVRSLPSKKRLFLLYVVHRRGVPLYPFGPSDTLVSLPPWTEEEWLADSIYSHPLAPDVQRAKFFAIEATHDLRTYQAGAPRTLRQALKATRSELAALVGGTGLPAASFLRRAARPNEIYWVVSEQSLSELVERALARVEP